MKYLLPFFLLSVVIISISCESSPVVGGEDVVVLDGAKFSVDSTYIVNEKFYATGTVKNTGNKRFTPYWYVEGSFFANSNKSLKLGGSSTRFGFALEGGQTTFWKLSFSDSDINTHDYQNFTVSELRAYREKTE